MQNQQAQKKILLFENIYSANLEKLYMFQINVSLFV